MGPSYTPSLRHFSVPILCFGDTVVLYRHGMACGVDLFDIVVLGFHLSSDLCIGRWGSGLAFSLVSYAVNLDHNPKRVSYLNVSFLSTGRCRPMLKRDEQNRIVAEFWSPHEPSRTDHLSSTCVPSAQTDDITNQIE
jgi:hypothetical protein